VAFNAEGSGGIGAEPVTAGFALRIDALHGEAGQKLHLFSLSGRKAQAGSVRPLDGGTEQTAELPFSAKTIREKKPWGNFLKKLRLDASQK
jgi:hypothetical protein